VLGGVQEIHPALFRGIEMDNVLELILQAEDEAFNAMGKSFRKYEPVYEMIKACRMMVEDRLFPSEQMDIETLPLRHDDKQEVRL
jgi:hypothetical protein